MKEKPFYKSKKFWAVITGVGIVLGKELLNIPEESLKQVAGMVMTYIVGQGIADAGKNSK